MAHIKTDKKYTEKKIRLSMPLSPHLINSLMLELC